MVPGRPQVVRGVIADDWSAPYMSCIMFNNANGSSLPRSSPQIITGGSQATLVTLKQSTSNQHEYITQRIATHRTYQRSATSATSCRPWDLSSALAAVVFKGYEQDMDQSKDGGSQRMDRHGMSLSTPKQTSAQWISACNRCQHMVHIRTWQVSRKTNAHS